MKIENQELEILMDGFSQTLSEIKDELSSIKKSITSDDSNNPESALTIDLLNKISETIDQAKKCMDKDDLREFTNIVISVIQQLQDEANKSNVEFLNQAIADLNNLVKQPSVVENKYAIDFKSSKTFIAVVLLTVGIGVSLYFNYDQFQENGRLQQNDVKYRYVQMKGGIVTDDLLLLNDSFVKSEHFRDSVQQKVIEFETLVKQKAYNQAVKQKNEEDRKQIERKLKDLTK